MRVSNICRKLFLCVMAASSMAFVPVAGQAAVLTKADFRARVVDYCLYDQWARAKKGETKGILPGCRCAAKGFVKGLKKAELSPLLESGTLSRAQKKVVLTKYAQCRK